MSEVKQREGEYGIFLLLDKEILPKKINYFEVLLREGPGPVFEHRGSVMTFNSQDGAEEYAQTNLWQPGITGWRVQKIGNIKSEQFLQIAEEASPFRETPNFFYNLLISDPSLVSSTQ